MFGTNSIRGQSAFKDIGDKLLVTSRFLSLQGEGPFQGRPALFVRLAYCNLNCSWCDSFFDEGNEFTIDELIEQSLKMIWQKYGHLEKCGIVVTGGEPSLQTNVVKFLNSYNLSSAAFLQIESNGIIPIEHLRSAVTLVVSPKCSEKTGKYLTPHAATLHRASCLKFIVSSASQSPYHIVPDWAFEWQQDTGNPIYVSPMNIYKLDFLEAARKRVNERKEHSIDYRSTVDEVVSGWDDKVIDREQNRLNHEYAFKYAADKGLFLTLQMHLFGAAA